MTDFHWLIDMIQSVDAGLIVLNSKYEINVWNTFMENHSARSSESIRDSSIFDLYPELKLNWLKKKIDSVFQLNNRAFSSWEQRPYLFKFNNYRPITGSEPYMYQNISIVPLNSIDGNVDRVCIIIYDVTDIASQRKELQNVNIELKKLSRTDALTGLTNRGHWEECLNLEYKRFHRDKIPRVLIMFDIDHFKNVNDTHGHPAGDEVIKDVANILTDNQRGTDFSGRYGGEEFVIILTNVTEQSALIFSERLRKSIEKSVVKYDDLELKVTVSLGISELDDSCNDTDEWLKRADDALYTAKGLGRNNSVLYSQTKH